MPGPHGFAVRYNIARLAHLDRSRGSSRPAISSVRHAAASTASRPNVRDDGQRPSSGQDGGAYSFDLQKRFIFAKGAGQDLLICPSGKISGPAGWVEPFAKPIALSRNMMGIASLHPSCKLDDPHGEEPAKRASRTMWPVAHPSRRALKRAPQDEVGLAK
jgi:hypothetical protein